MANSAGGVCASIDCGWLYCAVTVRPQVGVRSKLAATRWTLAAAQVMEVTCMVMFVHKQGVDFLRWWNGLDF